MRKICESIYSILVSRLIIDRIISTKYLFEYFLKYYNYLSISRESIDCKLDSSIDNMLYKKLLETKIKTIDISIDKKNNKLVSSYCLLKQQLE